MTSSFALRDQVRAAILAGIAGGVLIEAFWLGLMLATGGTFAQFTGTFAFVAATVMGPRAYADPSAVPVGVALHACVALGWAIGYVYLVRTQPQVLARPWLSGAAYGIVVYVFMQIILITAGQYHRPSSAQAFFAALIAHVVFYGLPVALVASSVLRGSRSAAAERRT